MTLELLLATSCWFSTSPVYTNGTENACMKMGESYYHYEKLDEQVKEIEKHIPTPLIFTATLLSSIEKRKASIPIYRGTYFGVEVPNNDARVFGGYEHGF